MIKEILLSPNATVRDKWVMKELALISRGKTILDAGAGEQKYKKYCNHLNYISQDFCQYDGKGNSSGLQTEKWDYEKIDIISDITDIPIADESVDVILCTEVFEHISEPIKAITEFNRILKKNGKIILTAPVCSLTHFAPYYYYNGFSRYFYEYILKKEGFRIEKIEYNGNFYDYIKQELFRVPKVITKYSAKYFPDLLFYILSFPIFILLTILSKRKNNSSELICFGIHVIAIK